METREGRIFQKVAQETLQELLPTSVANQVEKENFVIRIPWVMKDLECSALRDRIDRDFSLVVFLVEGKPDHEHWAPIFQSLVSMILSN